MNVRTLTLTLSQRERESGCGRLGSRQEFCQHAYCALVRGVWRAIITPKCELGGARLDDTITVKQFRLRQ